MTTGYYREFGALEKLSMKIGRELRNKPIETALHLKSRLSGSHELTLIRPRLSSEVPSGFRGLVEILRAQEVHTVKVFRQPPRDAAPDQGLLWRIEIYTNDDEIIIVRCADIKGLPDEEA
jgi:hypothetical protein